MAQNFKITYSVLDADMDVLHQEFEKEIARVRKTIGSELPSFVGGKAEKSGKFLENRNPANTDEVVSRFHEFPSEDLGRVIEISKKAQKSWGNTDWRERVKILRRAADLISERRMEISVCLSLEVGKNRLESLGDTEESADLFRYYSSQLEEANGYVKPLARLSPNEDTRSVLRPYGVFAVISPFNFPMALSAGMAGAALLGGNSVIIKPSQDAPWSAHFIYEALRDAGLPTGLFQVVYGSGTSLGEKLVAHPSINGIAFTGSRDVGMKIWRSFSKEYVKPVLMELGGKNAAIITASADLEKATDGCLRSAFGLSGQKCSALSRVYVDSKVREEFLKLLASKVEKMVVGDPLERAVFMGPVINERAKLRHLNACKTAASEGKIISGGDDLSKLSGFEKGHFARPTIALLLKTSALFRDEIFAPFLSVAEVSSLDEAIACTNDSQYGLTSGIFSENAAEVERFMTEVEAGILYSNRKTGATTGAWPGVQTFCGWKGSGGSGKGGCGPYYVSQFMREQSQTRML